MPSCGSLYFGVLQGIFVSDELFFEQLRLQLSRPFRPFVDDEVREVVFRAVLGNPTFLSGVLLSVEGGDPSPELLARLHAAYPGIRSGSAAEARGGPGTEEYGYRGTLYVITELLWHGTEHCNVKCGVVFGPLCGYGHRYRVELRNGRWVVTGRTFAWKS